jgi:hypothetical protein
MSKHISRRQRWTQDSPAQYSSNLGKVVYRQKAWYGVVNYQTLAVRESAHAPPEWRSHTDRLGPFKRPRDAMVALEREATMLRNRYGGDALINDQLWAET